MLLGNTYEGEGVYHLAGIRIVCVQCDRVLIFILSEKNIYICDFHSNAILHVTMMLSGNRKTTSCLFKEGCFYSIPQLYIFFFLFLFFFFPFTLNAILPSPSHGPSASLRRKSGSAQVSVPIILPMKNFSTFAHHMVLPPIRLDRNECVL